MTNQPHPDWALSHKRPGTELRLIRGRYYLYEYKTIYDKERKGPKKVSGKLLGSITEEDGFVPSDKRRLEKEATLALSSKPACKEYGVSALLTTVLGAYADQLKSQFPHHWKALLAIAYCRFVFRCPLKNMPFRLDQSFLPNLIGLRSFNDKTASRVLKEVGGMHIQQLSYMRSFLTKGEYLLMDATHVFSNSEQITLARKGYNSQMNFDPQFNLLYLYSSKTHMPVYYRILPGNIREVKAFKNSLLEVGLDSAVIVADKGFYSQKNVELLRKEHLRFILPLKRDNTLIDYSLLANSTFKEEDQFFAHEGRIIWYQEYTWDRMSMFIFLDESLRLHEERDYLTRIATHPETHTLEEYHKKKGAFGTLVMLTNLKQQQGVEVYQTYKSRMSIEVMFDGMKNVLDADHTYMQDEQTFQGWMFVNHITLQWYQHLYIELKTKGLLNNFSVNDYIQLLTDVKKTKINNVWHLNEVTGNTVRLLKKVGLPEELYNT
jgi:transposase